MTLRTWPSNYLKNRLLFTVNTIRMLLYCTWSRKNWLDQVRCQCGMSTLLPSLSSAINLLYSDGGTKYCPHGRGEIQRCENLSIYCIHKANPINRSRLVVDYEKLITQSFISTETAPQQCLYEPSLKIVQTSFPGRRFP